MSPLPYQADTTEKISLVNPSTTVPVSSMGKKASVAMIIGTLFVAGNSWKKGPTSDSAAAVSVSHFTFGGATFDSCDDCDFFSKDQCHCMKDNCIDPLWEWGLSDAAEKCMTKGSGCDNIGCWIDCVEENDNVRQCFDENNCF
mmetsp:Transcript_2613/g.2920  ORF Transcript_2613/g.2920 Transcript_2613/m.2920 type:complete len:143 (+) Transcript_2613:150-578(+)